MKALPLLAAAVMCAALVDPAAAQSTRLKPGLWEHTLSTGGAGGQKNSELDAAQQQMAAEMAKMPPEQRKQVEAMMGKHGVGAGPAGGMAAKVCLTKEDVERDDFAQQPGNCRNEVLNRTANTIRIKTVCVGKHPASGETTVTLQSPTAYTMKSVMNSTENGKPMQVNVDGSGKWLAADCGSVKPMQQRQQ